MNATLVDRADQIGLTTEEYIRLTKPTVDPPEWLICRQTDGCCCPACMSPQGG